MSCNQNISPVGWYIGAYLARFVEIGCELNNDPENRFPTWENTVIVKADDLDEAYDKIESIGIEHGEPYLGGNEALIKLFYLALNNIAKKWTMPIRDWKAALTQFTIQYGERIPQN